MYSSIFLYFIWYLLCIYCGVYCLCIVYYRHGNGLWSHRILNVKHAISVLLPKVHWAELSG